MKKALAVLFSLIGSVATSSAQDISVRGSWFLCDSENGVRKMLDSILPQMSDSEIFEKASETDCMVRVFQGFEEEPVSTYINSQGDKFSIRTILVNGKALYTWRLLEVGVTI